jgi:hypothetical protein
MYDAAKAIEALDDPQILDLNLEHRLHSAQRRRILKESMSRTDSCGKFATLIAANVPPGYTLLIIVPTD